MEQTSFTTFVKEAWEINILKLSDGSVTLGSVLIGITALAVGLIVAKIISRKVIRALSLRFGFDKNSTYILEKILFYVLGIFALLFAMKFARIPITVFTVLGGAAAIGVGFGSQNLVNNFLSGLILMMERPIKVGDFIDVDGLFGEVQEIGMRSTSIVVFGNRHIVVPNSSFLEKNVLNWTRIDSIISTSIDVGVIYGSDTRKVEELLLQAVKSHDAVYDTPGKEPVVFFSNFGDNALEFKVFFTILLKTLGTRRQVESDIRFKIDELFKENDLVIAFPQRDVHLYSPQTLSVKLARDTD